MNRPEYEEAKSRLAKLCYDEAKDYFDYLKGEGPDDSEDTRFTPDGLPAEQCVAEYLWELWYESEATEELMEDEKWEDVFAILGKGKRAAQAFFDGYYQFVKDTYGRESNVTLNIF